MYRKISCDVKLAAINLHERQLLSLENILACVGFSESTFWRILKLWRETGDVVSISNRIRGRPRILSATMSVISFVLSVTAQSGSWMNYSCYWIPIVSYLCTIPPFTRTCRCLPQKTQTDCKGKKGYRILINLRRRRS